MLLVFAAAAVAVATAATSSPRDVAPPQHRVLTNADAGTVTHPLLPHRAHLARRRRELRAKHGVAPDAAAAPPRPHASRHSHAAERTRGGTRNLLQQTGALYEGYGTHYVDLWVGSPVPQRQTVIVDTGSGITAFPCSGCAGCGDSYHTDGYFQEAQSATFRALTCDECAGGTCRAGGCRLSMAYAEGSRWSAYEGTDRCYAGGPHDAALAADGPPATAAGDAAPDGVAPADASQFAFDLAFGCQTSITGLFKTQLADGIMGMENAASAFWKQMFLKDAIPRPEFSLCFSRAADAELEGSGAGALTLGGAEPSLHSTPMVFAKNVESSGFYVVRLKAVFLREEGGGGANATAGGTGRMISLGVDEAALNAGHWIVDSGTTDTYFPRALAAPLQRAWRQLTGDDFGHDPVSLSAEDLAALPTLVLFLEGYDGAAVGDEPADGAAGYVGENAGEWADPRDVVLAVPAAHYMEFNADSGKYAARFYAEEASGGVLGANAMMGHDVYFDTARGRLGFAESDCDYAGLVAGAGTGAPEPVSRIASEKIAVDEEMEGDK